MADSPTIKLTSESMRDVLDLGFKYLANGQLTQASACCERLLAEHEGFADAYYLKGLIALASSETNEAESAFVSATNAEPQHGRAWAQLARLYVVSGELLEAELAIEQAASNHEDNPAILNLIGAVYAQMGQHAEAHGWLAQTVAAKPDNISYNLSLATNHIYFGRFDEAEALLQSILASQPGNPNAHWLLATVRKAADEEHISELRQWAAKVHLPAQAHAYLNYALGKELEDLEQWSDAFKAFSRGAAARRKITQFDEQAEIELYAELERVFTAGSFEKSVDGHDGASPIFIVGQPRTGTTLVERLISSHSQVSSAGELRQFDIALRRLIDAENPKPYSVDQVQVSAQVDFEQLGNNYLETSRAVRGATPRFVDKQPMNYLYLPLILKALPNAKVVHVYRDPMDTCFAGFKHLFNEFYPHSYSQEEMARHHARYIRLMQAWRGSFSDRVLEISYEQIVADVESQARLLMEYLGLTWDEECLNYFSQPGAVSSASAVQVREPVYGRSVDRWRKYESELQPMYNTLIEEGVLVGS